MMKLLKNKLAVSMLAVAAIFLGGCLVSGTFIVVEVFTLNSPTSGLYSDAVDLTDNEDWQDHKDDIDRIDVVGFEVWMTNSSSSLTYSAYLDDPQPALYTTAGQVQANTTLILEDLEIPVTSGSEKVITYAESLTLIQNTETIRTLLKSGQFDYYALTSGSGSATVDSVKVVITVSASST